MKRVILSLVTWNSEKHLDHLFQSLAAQTYTHCELLMTDNNSSDGTERVVGDWIPKLPFPTTFFRGETNIGFARGHNQHIQRAIQRRATFVLVINPDLILESHALEILVQFLEQHPDVGSAGGKLFRASFQHERGIPELSKERIFDSAGIVMTRARRFFERGEGEEDRGQFVEGPVFGISGAFVLYRLRALVETALPKEGTEEREFFDEDFFAYKEDVDLAWRLQRFGWPAWYVPTAVAWHHRAFQKKRRRSIPSAIRALSWRNHLFVLLKNEEKKDFLRAFPLTILRESAKFFWFCCTEWRTLATLPSLFRLWNRIKRKRQWIMEHRPTPSSPSSS